MNPTDVVFDACPCKQRDSPAARFYRDVSSFYLFFGGLVGLRFNVRRFQ